MIPLLTALWLSLPVPVFAASPEPSAVSLTEDEPDVDDGAAETSTTSVTEIEPSPRAGMTCRRVIGLVGGLFDPGRSWRFATYGDVHPAGSILLGQTCDISRGEGPSLAVGVQSAPFYVTREIGTSDGRRQLLTLSVGALIEDSGPLRLGPVVTAGIGRVGGGLRVLHLPFPKDAGDNELLRGFEYRLQAFYVGGLEVQLMAGYTFQTKRFRQ